MLRSCFCTHAATTEIYTLSLHDALPILRVLSPRRGRHAGERGEQCDDSRGVHGSPPFPVTARGREGSHRSEEHTCELQSLTNLVCRLLLEKKKQDTINKYIHTARKHQAD